MNFKDQMAADLNVFFNAEEFGVDVTYNGTTITAVVDTYDAVYQMYPQVRNTDVTLLVKTTDVPDPANGDVVVIDSVTYQVTLPVADRDPFGNYFRLTITEQMTRVEI